jgi:succinylglutamate desuccinylase
MINPWPPRLLLRRRLTELLSKNSKWKKVMTLLPRPVINKNDDLINKSMNKLYEQRKESYGIENMTRNEENKGFNDNFGKSLDDPFGSSSHVR